MELAESFEAAKADPPDPPSFVTRKAQPPSTPRSQGWGLLSPRADHPIAIEFPGYPVVRLRPIEGLEFVEETVIALDSTTELAHHLFRECWAGGTGKHRGPDGGRGSHAPRFAWRWHR